MRTRNYKKFTYGLLLSIFSSCSFAFLLPSHEAFHGFYIGAGLGGGNTTYNLNTNANVVPADSLISFGTPYSFSNNLSASHFIGLLNAGYGKTWKQVYLGGEVFLNGSNYSQTINGASTLTQSVPDTSVTFSTLVSEKSSLSPVQGGGDVRFGFLSSPGALIYGRVGGVVSNLSLESNTVGSYSFDFVNQTFTFPLQVTTHKSTVGLRLGAGMEQFIRPNLSFKLDYIYTYYGSISTNASRIDPLTDSTVTITNNSNSKIMDNAILLSLSYYI